MSGTGDAVPDLLDGLAVDQGIVLLPVRLETRFVTDDTGSKLRVRVYPDEIHIDAHQPALTDGEVAAAGRYWDAVWRSGRGQPDAERAAFVQLADRVGVTRAVWVARATHPDETDRPVDPVPEGQQLAAPPVLAPVSRIDSTFAGPAVARLLPDRWVVIGYRGGAEVFRQVGAPIPESLPVGPGPRDPAAPGATTTDPNTIPLDDELRWLADIDAAVAVGMAVDVPLAATEGLDRLVVVGVRAHETPDDSAARLGELLDAQRFTSGLGFVTPGAPTNNTADDRSAWSRRPDAAAVFDAEQLHDPAPTTFAASTASALGVRVDALLGLEDASMQTGDSEGALLVALWPATVGYFLEQLLQPIVGDATIEAVRRLFVGALRGLGPLPALRIGAQPYGVLPVTSLARWQPASSEGPQSVMVRLIRILVPEWLAATRSGARTVPHVGRPGADPDQELLDILARDALSGSYRLRPVRGGANARALRLFTPDLDGAGDALADATLRLLGGGSVIPRLTGFEFEPRTARIRRPVVIAGELSETDPLPADAAVGLNYLAFLASRRDHTDSFSGPGSTSILFKLAQHACQLADADAAVRLTRPASVATVKAALEPDLVDAVTARPSQTMPRLLARSVREVAAEPTLPDQTVGDFLATVSDGDLAHLSLPDVTNAVRRATIVRNALGRLADEPTAALDRMTRAVIDVCSHRLDAWITAFATQRLAAVRATRPAGVHVGGFGWVEDLQPKVAPSALADPPADEPGPLVTDPTNAGYVVAPSLTQAATAGILLSGHLSHAAGDGESAPFAVDLSSDRVRLASWLIDGIRQGQPLGALLGYRFERNLHERSGAGLELDRYIRPLRAVAPLVADRSDDVAPTVEAVESVAASNVVDGLSLLTRFRANPAVVDAALAGASPEEHDAVIAELAGLGETADAVADLVTAETVHQLVSGQVARTAASLDALGSGLGPPPEPEVNETPRSGSAYEHRLIALAPVGTEVPEGWSTGADRPRRVAEPRLDALIGAALGRADTIRAVVRVSGPGGTSPTLVQATVADLGRCALDVAYGALGAPPRIELDVLDHVRARPDVAREALLEVVHEDDADWPASTWPVGSIPMDDALDQARWLAEALEAGRPLSASDLAVGDRSGLTGARRDELGARLDVVTARYRAAATALTDARDRATDPSATDPAARLLVALDGLAAFGVVTAEDAVHAARSAVGDGLEPLRAAAEAVLAEIAPVVAGLDQPLPADGAGSVPLPEVERLRSMFGPSFVVLPLVDAPEGWAEARAASSAPAFLRGDAAAPAAWLQQVARVRAPVDRYLWAVSGAGRFDAVQLPPAPTWVALPLEPEAAPPAAATSIVLHAHDTTAGPALTGVVIDTWVDTIPAAKTTVGVAFNFDEPGARPPQAVLLALPPELGAPWTLDALVDVVREAADLARVRVVGPDEAPWLGRYLPALYIADNPLGDTIGIDLASLVTRDAGGGP